MNHLPTSLTTLRHILENLRTRGQSTMLSVDIIRAWKGIYLVDIGMSVGESPNAGLGKLISRHADALGIVKRAVRRPALDDRNPRRRTRCALYTL